MLVHEQCEDVVKHRWMFLSQWERSIFTSVITVSMRTGELVNCRIPGCLMSIKHVHRGKKQTSRKVDFSESLGRWDAYLGMVQPFVGPIWSNVWVTSISSPFIWIGRVVCFCMVLCCFVFCFRIYCFVFQPGAVFLVFWCILKLKSLICVLFAALLELSFWLLVFGFGFTWILVLDVLVFLQTPPSDRF